jgi:putative oxidoreductase
MTTPCTRHEYALFIIRLVLGTTFILHGSQKVLGLFGGPGLAGYVQMMSSMNVHPILSYCAAFFELIGGVMVLLGIGAEIGALLLIPIMIGAVLLVHLPHGFFIQNNGCEYSLNLMILSIVVIVGGPGRWYLWNPFKK